jgi:hypothetical protein
MALYCYESVARAVEVFYALRRRWWPGSKRVLKDIAEAYPEVYRLADPALQPDEKQVRNTMALLRFVLDELGGPVLFEGDTGPKTPHARLDET